MKEEINHMYSVVLALHNVVRWIVLIFGVLALFSAYRGWFAGRAWTELDRRYGVFFGSAMDTQLLLGLVLYFFLSPLTTAMLGNFALTRSNPQIRFFGVEHILLMVVAVVLVHVGSVMSRRPTEDVAKHRTAAIFYSLAVVVVLIAIPWWRPLFPGLGGF
jgi:uncharacterized membrane protein YozB (DUF420 family)